MRVAGFCGPDNFRAFELEPRLEPIPTLPPITAYSPVRGKRRGRGESERADLISPCSNKTDGENGGREGKAPFITKKRLLLTSISLPPSLFFPIEKYARDACILFLHLQTKDWGCNHGNSCLHTTSFPALISGVGKKKRKRRKWVWQQRLARK